MIPSQAATTSGRYNAAPHSPRTRGAFLILPWHIANRLYPGRANRWGNLRVAMLEAVNLKLGAPVTLPSGRLAYVTSISRHTVEFLYAGGDGLVEITRTALREMLK